MIFGKRLTQVFHSFQQLAFRRIKRVTGSYKAAMEDLHQQEKEAQPNRATSKNSSRLYALHCPPASHANNSWSVKLTSLQALQHYMESICNSNRLTIQLLEQKQEEITAELRNLLKANEVISKTIQRIQKITKSNY